MGVEASAQAEPTVEQLLGRIAELEALVVQLRGIIEVPPAQPEVVEVIRLACRCPNCGTKNVAAPPSGWDPRQRFGPRLQALLAYLHHQHHVAFRRLRQLLRDLLGLSISEGAIAAGLARTSAGMQEVYAGIRQQVRGSPAGAHAVGGGSDETRARVAGQTCWSWVVQTRAAVYHWVGRRRSTQELLDFFAGSYPQVQESDCYSAQLASPVKQKQVCLAHQLRDLLYAEEHGDQAYARKMARLIRLGIRLAKRRPLLPEALYAHQVRRLLRLGHVLGWKVRTNNAFGQALQERYQRLEACWWVFLERGDVEPTNNASERAGTREAGGRPVVVHRKVTGGFRSQWGADAYSRFTSVAQTARKQGQPLFPTLLGLLAPHPAPIPE
jgi:transposase